MNNLKRLLQTIDSLLDGFTMYRLTVYYLWLLLGVGVAAAGVGALPFTAAALLVSAAVLVGVSIALNPLLAKLAGVRTNPESALITALILSLIIQPTTSAVGLATTAVIAAAAILSKYVLIARNIHIFNPAAVGAVAGSLLLGTAASWWVGTPIMVIPTVLLGALLLRRIRRFTMVGVFIASAAAVLAIGTVGLNLHAEWQFLTSTSLIFFAIVMLTEPLTAPPERGLLLYAGGAGLLYTAPKLGLAPEEVLLIVNLLGFILFPRARFKLRLQRVERIANNALGFWFEKPPRLAFQAGQYLEWSLPHSPHDRRGWRRYLSLASAPDEKEVMVAVKIDTPSSTFKQALAKLTPGAVLEATTVNGKFTLPEDTTRPCVLIAGGIGITPFRSMIKELLLRQESRPIRLLYAASTPEDFAFRDLFAEAEQYGVKTTLLPSTATSGWRGDVGHITTSTLRDLATGADRPLYYVSGSAPFVEHCQSLIRGNGVVAGDIRCDYFPGLAKQT